MVNDPKQQLCFSSFFTKFYPRIREVPANVSKFTHAEDEVHLLNDPGCSFRCRLAKLGYLLFLIGDNSCLLLEEQRRRHPHFFLYPGPPNRDIKSDVRDLDGGDSFLRIISSRGPRGPCSMNKPSLSKILIMFLVLIRLTTNSTHVYFGTLPPKPTRSIIGENHFGKFGCRSFQ